MMVERAAQRSRLDMRAAGRLLLWLAVSLALSFVFFRDFWAALPAMLAPSTVLQYHAAPWGVLFLCFISLLVKRKQVDISASYSLPWNIFNIVSGAGIVAGAVLMPPLPDYLVFRVLLASLGVFIILFGSAARIPAILLAVYGFAISFPIAIERFFSEGYSLSAIIPVRAVIDAAGLHIHIQGQTLSFNSIGGEPVTAAITVACAGPVTMGVFIALFALMTLDRPLTPGRGLGMFLFGAIGTWAQSVIRLIILLVVGYYLGKNAMWTAHYWTVYILFPLWYLLFAYLYFQQLNRHKGKAAYQQAGVR